MSTDEEATAVIVALNGTLYCGNTLGVGWAVPRHNPDPADCVGVRGGSQGSGVVATIESDAEAAMRLAGNIETLAMQAGSGGLNPGTARSEAVSDAKAPPRPSVPSAPDVNPVIQAAAEVVIAANGVADAAMSLANRAADAATAASNAAMHGSTLAGEAMSAANMAAEQNAYAANKAADAAANVADKAAERARNAEVAASLLRHAHE